MRVVATPSIVQLLAPSRAPNSNAPRLHRRKPGYIDRGKSLMKQGGKGRRTPRRTDVRSISRQRGASLGEWLRRRLEQAQKRNKAPRRRRPSGSGVTAVMKQISGEAAAREPEYVVEHSLPNRAMRRSGRVRDTGARNVPYVAPVVEQGR